MTEIDIDNSKIGLTEIQEIINRIESEKPNQLKIICPLELVYIDQLLFAYLEVLVFKYKINTINIYLNKNTHDTKAIENFVRVHLNFHYLLFEKEIIQIFFEGVKLDILKESKKEFINFTNFQKVFPILIIDSIERFNQLFNISFSTILEDAFNNNDKSHLHKFPTQLKWDKSSEDNFTNYRKYFLSNINCNPIDITTSFYSLCRIQFLQSLNYLKIASIYFADSLPNRDIGDIRCSELKGKDAVSYYKELKPLVQELENSPIYLILLFSAILGSEINLDPTNVRNSIDTRNKDIVVENIYGIWNYTKQIYHGIKELAKNIVEHSTNIDGDSMILGVLSIRIYDYEKWKDLKKTTPHQEFVDTIIKLKKQRVLEVSVIDLGELGIMKTLNTYTKNISTTNSTLLEEDKEIILHKAFGLKDLLNPSTMTLNQQILRNLTHIGLQIFANIISSNNGIIEASSFAIDNSRENVLLPENVEHENIFINLGTHFTFSVPISAITSLKKNYVTDFKNPYAEKPMELNMIEKLLDYEVVTNNNTNTSKNKIIIHDVPIKNIEIIGRHDETKLWHTTKNTIETALQTSDINKSIVCLDLTDTSFNESVLYRFLGSYELYFSKIPLIIKGIPSELYDSLSKTIVLLSRSLNNKLPFWNEDKPMIFYSYVEINLQKFYYVDALWGKNQNEFVYLNYIISQYYFNAYCTLHTPGMPEIDANVLPRSPLLFYNDYFLLPFELLLTNEKMSTLFENNISIILQNELNN